MTWHDDQVEIADLSYRYAACADDRDADGAAALFTPDGVLMVPEPPASLGPVREHRGQAAIRRSFAPLDELVLTFHAMAGIVIDAGAEPGTARGRVSCIAHHVAARGAGGRDHVWYLHYRDDYLRTDEGWRIARRDLYIDLLDSRPVDLVR
jgi:ketosteroid isomerase-like protein